MNILNQNLMITSILRILLFTIIFTNNPANGQFKDFVIIKNQIYALSSKGAVSVFDTNGVELKKKFLPHKYLIFAIAKDRKDALVIVDESFGIKRYNEVQNIWESLGIYKEDFRGMLFDSKNVCYAITNVGIDNMVTHEFYPPTKSLNKQINYKDKWFATPCLHIDKKDNIWLGFDHGEWGGDLAVFNTNLKKYEIPKINDFSIELSPINSFFEDSNSVYISGGLSHMMSSSGLIAKFEGLSSHTILKSESYWKETDSVRKIKKLIAGEYIGPATFNPFENSIYFYSQNGFFKGNINTDLSKMNNWKAILKPNFKWTNGRSNAVGSLINVLKMNYIDKNKIMFLTENDGIGLINNGKLMMIK
jgi:hypothetical protein